MARWILLCAGGTGGHLFPAEALAHVLKERGWKICLVTDRRAERFAGHFPADERVVVDSATPSGRNPVQMLRALWTIWRGVRQSHALISRLKPAAAVGFGGYPTLPPIWAATRRGVPSMIHEQNAVIGRANRALASRVQRIAGGFLKPEGRHASRIVQTGNPVRPAVIEAAATPYAPPSAEGPFRLLAFGGSQGARYFAEVVPAAAELLDPALRARLSVTLQARDDDAPAARDKLAALGIAAEISAFFTDMAARIRDAHLVVSRSGASTVSEIAAIGRPAVLVPYPYALDHDQAANAAALAAAGGAEVRRQEALTAEALAEILATWSADPARLAAMAAAARSAGRPNAAVLLADAVESIASGPGATKGDPA